MKSKHLIQALLLICGLMPAQNFAPFNKDVTKRFYNSNNPSDDGYFFYADSTSNPGAGITVFRQYFVLGVPDAPVDVAGCGFWSGNAAWIGDTTWLGVNIIYNSNNQHLILTNFRGDTLDFDFSTTAGDTSLFYQNTTDKFYIHAGTTQTEMVYAVNDAVKTFTILHLDANGQPVNSTLHGTTLKLGDQTGLIRFIDAFHFPVVEKNLSLKGQLNPLIGSYQMRFEDLYPFQPGDSMQYLADVGYLGKFLSNYKVVGRNESADSVTITFTNYNVPLTNFAPLNTMEQSTPPAYPNILRFPKNSDLVGYPHNRLNPGKKVVWGNGYELRTAGTTQIHCGERHSFTIEHLSSIYCDSCQCIGNMDGFGQKFPLRHLTSGIGVSYAFNKPYDWPNPNSSEQQGQLFLRYSSIGGTVCGTYDALAIPENNMETLKLFPNPAQYELQLSTPVDHIKIFSVDGAFIKSISDPSQRLNLSDLKPGFYFFELSKQGRLAYYKITKL
jgi:hypothetical protein